MTKSFAVGPPTHFSSPHRYLPSRAKISHPHLSTWKLCFEIMFRKTRFQNVHIICQFFLFLFFGLSSVKHLFISTINSLDENKHSYALTKVLPKFRYKGISEILLKRTLPITKHSLPIAEIEA